MGVQPTPDAGAACLTAYARSLIRYKACQLCRRPGFSRSDAEDLAQDLTLALLRKAHLYDPARGASYDTFADRVIDSAARMILRARRQLKRAPGFAAQSLDTGTADVRGRHVPLADRVADTDPRTGRAADGGPDTPGGDDAEAVARALAGLPPHLLAVAERLKHGSVASAARDLGVSRRRVYAAVALIRRRFEGAGLGRD